MGLIYTLNFEDIAGSAVKDEYLTVAAIIAADTAGHQARLLRIWLGPADDIPEDHTLNVEVGLLDVSAGSAGAPTTSVTGAQMHKARRLALDSLITGGIRYGGANEPSDYTTLPVLHRGGFNTRGVYDFTWHNVDSRPEIPRDHLCGLRIAPRAAKQLRVTGGMEFELA